MSLVRLLSQLSERSIVGAIAFAETADLRTISIEELEEVLEPLLRAFGCFAIRIGEGRYLYRAMKHRKDEAHFVNVCRIYPDPAFLNKLGRANREHEVVFYLSGDPVVALHEVRAAVGDNISVLSCRPKNEAPLLIPIGINELMHKRGAKMGGDFPPPPDRIRTLLNNEPSHLRKYHLIEEFLIKEFLKDVAEGQEHAYKTTVAIAEFFFDFDVPGEIDGIGYPSIAAQWTHANVALLPEAFHRCYEPVTCQQITVEAMLPDLGLRHCHDRAAITDDIRADGTIHWKQPQANK